MSRRKFLSTSLLALPVLTSIDFGSLFLGIRKHVKGFVVRASESRYFAKSEDAGKYGFGRCIVSGKDTANALYLSDSGHTSFRDIGGPSLHIHHEEDEIFYVVSGEFLFQLGDDVFLAKAGDTAFIPRGTAHTFANFTKNSTGRMITIHQPISNELEKFYEGFSRIGYMDQETLKGLFTDAEFEKLMKTNSFVGPPIDVTAALKKLGR